MLIETDLFTHMPELHTPRLTLRAVRMTDARDIYA